MMMDGMGGFGMGIVMLIPVALLVWFLVFSIIVVVKLNRITKQLEKR